MNLLLNSRYYFCAEWFYFGVENGYEFALFVDEVFLEVPLDFVVTKVVVSLSGEPLEYGCHGFATYADFVAEREGDFVLGFVVVVTVGTGAGSDVEIVGKDADNDKLARVFVAQLLEASILGIVGCHAGCIDDEYLFAFVCREVDRRTFEGFYLDVVNAWGYVSCDRGKE